MAKLRTNNGGNTPASTTNKAVKYQKQFDPEDYDATRQIISEGGKNIKPGMVGYEDELARRNNKLKEIQNTEAEKTVTMIEAKKKEMEAKRREAGTGSNVEDRIKNEDLHNSKRIGEPGTYGTPVKKVVYKKPTR